jgi:hypothetical protein
MIVFGSFLPSPLVGFSTTNSTQAWEPTLSWNQLHSNLQSEANRRRELVTSLGCDIHAVPKPMLAIFRWRLRVLSRLRFFVLDLRIENSTFN